MNNDYVRQTNEHLIEQKSINQIQKMFLNYGWLIQKIEPDYGEDLHIRPFENGKSKGEDFLAQIKGTQDIEQYKLKSRNQYSYSISLANLKQWQDYFIPVIVILWDISHEFGYWLYVQPFINTMLKRNDQWLENTNKSKDPKRKIHISKKNIIKYDDIESLEKVISDEYEIIRQSKNHFDIILSPNFGDKDAHNSYSSRVSAQYRVNELKALLIDKPKNLDYLVEMASILYSLNKFDEALIAINKACKIDRNDEQSKWIQACIKTEYSIKNSKPVSFLHESIQIFNSFDNIDDCVKKYNIGNCYSALEKHDIAFEYYTEALNAKGEPKLESSIWTNRGNCLHRLGRYAEGIKSCKKAIELLPSNWKAFSSLAHISAAIDDHENACLYFEKAFELNPLLKNEGENQLSCYSYSLYQLQKYDDALSVIDELLDIHPFMEAAINLKVNIVAQLLNIDDKYIDQFLHFLQCRLVDMPDDIQAIQNLLYIYKKMEVEIEYRKLLEEAVDLEKCRPNMLFDFAIILRNEGKIDKAIHLLERALDLEESHHICHNLALLYKEQGRYTEAIEKFRLSIGDESTSLRLLSEISDCYYLLGDFKSNIVILTKIIKMGAKSDRFELDLFNVLKQGNIEYTDYLIFSDCISIKKIDLDESFIREELELFLSDFSKYRESYYRLIEDDDIYEQSDLSNKPNLPAYKQNTFVLKSLTEQQISEIVKNELSKLREGWEDILILSDSGNSFDYIQFTEIICEVSDKNITTSEITSLSNSQSNKLQSLGFVAPNSSNGELNYSLNWSKMQMEYIVNLIMQVFQIFSSLDNIVLIVEN